MTDDIRSERIVINNRDRIRIIPISEVRYFQSCHKQITVQTTKEALKLSGSLDQIEQRYSHTLLRIHRNTLVNTQFIDSIEKVTEGQWKMVLIGIEAKLVISRRHTPAVRKWLR